jgi:hypothetical protein
MLNKKANYSPEDIHGVRYLHADGCQIGIVAELFAEREREYGLG